MNRNYSGYFGPPPMHCFCCGKAESQSGCVRGFTCGCDMWPLSACKTCHKCSKHCQCEKQPEKKSGSRFDYIYNADGTCGARYDCGKPGVVLAYDEFSPEGATWFCAECWSETCEDPFLPCFLEIVEDKRAKEVPPQK